LEAKAGPVSFFASEAYTDPRDRGRLIRRLLLSLRRSSFAGIALRTSNPKSTIAAIGANHGLMNNPKATIMSDAGSHDI